MSLCCAVSRVGLSGRAVASIPHRPLAFACIKSCAAPPGPGRFLSSSKSISSPRLPPSTSIFMPGTVSTNSSSSRTSRLSIIKDKLFHRKSKSSIQSNDTPAAPKAAAATTPAATTAAAATTTDDMADKLTFVKAVEERRTNYAIKDTDLPATDERIIELTKLTLNYAPSSFNAQSTRIVLLLKDDHKKYWDYVLEVLQPHIKPETKQFTENRIAGFKAGYGTALFFEDPEPVDALKKKFPNYEMHFPVWSEHTSAIHQYILWTALSAEGFGASLQHYNPLIDGKAKSEWNVPGDWSLRAQLVFGARAKGIPDRPAKIDNEKNLFVHK